MARVKTGIRLNIIDLDTIKYVPGTFAGQGAFIPNVGNAGTETLAALIEALDDALDGLYPDMATPDPA